jgi:hypothetical protein
MAQSPYTDNIVVFDTITTPSGTDYTVTSDVYDVSARRKLSLHISGSYTSVQTVVYISNDGLYWIPYDRFTILGGNQEGDHIINAESSVQTFVVFNDSDQFSYLKIRSTFTTPEISGAATGVGPTLNVILSTQY